MFGRLALLSILPAAAPLGGCLGSEKPPPIDLAGTWQSEIDQSVMSIEESGLFAIDIPGEKYAIVGTIVVDGSRVSFRNRPETRLCVDDDGVYDVEIVDDRLISREVRDTCPSRVLHMSRPWRRLSADRSPPKSDG